VITSDGSTTTAAINAVLVHDDLERAITIRTPGLKITCMPGDTNPKYTRPVAGVAGRRYSRNYSR
jgi:hypothetical protein